MEPIEEKAAAVLAESRAELWRRGILRWKLDASQREAYDLFRGSTFSRVVLEISRRWGKTFLLAVIAFEECLRTPKARVVYGAPSLKHLGEFILPTFEKLNEGAPPECQGRFNGQSGHWTFPNGSYVHLFGAESKAHADRGRGPSANLAVFDEAGFCRVLRYVLTSVMRPQLLETGGRTILGSTPAETPDHEFTAIAERAESRGSYMRRTIWDSPRYSRARVEQFIAEDAAEDGYTVEEYKRTDAFRREYLAERVIDQRLVVFPEWEALRKELIEPVERPEFFLGTSILDFGGADPHACLQAYWHWPRAIWVIEHELLLRDGQNTAELAEAIKAKEREAWGVEAWDGTLSGAKDPSAEMLAQIPEWMFGIRPPEEAEARQPWARWADNDLQLIRDLYELHKLAFIPTRKDSKELQVNNLRVLARAKQLRVHPRCKDTDRHFATTTWQDHKRRTYARHHGQHGDLLDCAVYGARNLDRRDPTPTHWHHPTQRSSPPKDGQPPLEGFFRRRRR
jgi:hypothetical protein